jgi:hypothetical protein
MPEVDAKTLSICRYNNNMNHISLAPPNSSLRPAKRLKKSSKSETPRLFPGLSQDGRLTRGDSILFPYGSYSAVSLFDNAHFVEIGTALPPSYTGCFINCRNYLRKVLSNDQQAVYTAHNDRQLGMVAAFAPEGFYEIRGILPGVTSLCTPEDTVAIARPFWR